jgi:hypothetical protein
MTILETIASKQPCPIERRLSWAEHPFRAIIPLRAETFTQAKALAAGRHNTNR